MMMCFNINRGQIFYCPFWCIKKYRDWLTGSICPYFIFSVFFFFLRNTLYFQLFTNVPLSWFQLYFSLVMFSWYGTELLDCPLRGQKVLQWIGLTVIARRQRHLENWWRVLHQLVCNKVWTGLDFATNEGTVSCQPSCFCQITMKMN
jgi:hypothetical protein